MTGPWIYSKIDEVIKQFFTVTSIAYRPMADPKSPLQSEMVPIYEVLRRNDLGGNIKLANQTLRELGYMTLIRPHPTHESRGVLYIFPVPENVELDDLQDFGRDLDDSVRAFLHHPLDQVGLVVEG